MTNDQQSPSGVGEPQCPKCGAPTEMGYGLAGGGMGAYEYCTAEPCDYFQKWQDPEMAQ